MITVVSATYCQPQEDDYQRIADETLFVVMERLREMHLSKTKKDIRKYNLLWELCFQRIIPERRFRFLVDWDPNTLTRPGAGRRRR